MSIQPQGEHMRKAVKWISEQRNHNRQMPLKDILDKASVKFDLSPLEVDFLDRMIREGAKRQSP